MKTSTSPLDARPFRPRAELERENALDAHYHRLGIQSVVAVLSQCRPVVHAAAADTRRDKTKA